MDDKNLRLSRLTEDEKELLAKKNCIADEVRKKKLNLKLLKQKIEEILKCEEKNIKEFQNEKKVETMLIDNSLIKIKNERENLQIELQKVEKSLKSKMNKKLFYFLVFLVLKNVGLYFVPFISDYIKNITVVKNLITSSSAKLHNFYHGFETTDFLSIIVICSVFFDICLFLNAIF